ncbi:MAG: GerAB/ArcD/ProY family transporter [Clostridia bacterium]
MEKNSDFKSIEFSNYEFVSIIVIMIFTNFVGIIPESIIKNCGSASIIGTIFLSILAYTIYRFLTTYIFKREFDLYEIMQKTFPKIFCKIFAIIFYLFLMLYIYVTISSIVFDLKETTYAQSTVFQLAIYFIIALFLITKKGFNSLFRIAGYISAPIIIYVIILFIFSIPFLSIENFFPLLGNGIKDIFISNFKNIGLFCPLFLTLFFGGNIKKHSRENLSNFNKIFLFGTVSFLLIITMFVGSMPSELLITRSSLIFDVSRIVAFSTTSIKFAPFMISFFSFISFLSSSFLLLIACMSLERLKVIKDYSKFIVISNLAIALLFLFPLTSIIVSKLENILYTLSIFVCIIFPIVTIFIYSLKNSENIKTKFNIKNSIAKLKKGGNVESYE